MAEREAPEKGGVVVVQFRGDDMGVLHAVVEGLREFFLDREPRPVGDIWAAIGETAQRVIDLQDPENGGDRV